MPSLRTRSRAALPAATSMLVAELLEGPPVPATVVAAHRFALYLDVAGRVLPVVTADAVPLPTAVRLAVRAGAASWGVGRGDTVPVGGGRIALPGFDIDSVRTWRPSRVRPASATSASTGSGGPGAEGEWLETGIRAVFAAPGCSDGGQDDHLSTQLVNDAVAALVGRGPGLTPSGDDALAGALLVAHAVGACDALAGAVRARLAATTAVSAALLDAAADGYAARPVVTLVDAAVSGDADAVSRALPAVLAIGHSSGRDLVTGVGAAIGALSTGLEERRASCGRSAA